MGLPITAEGIESEEILRHLRKLGTFKGQGYLYGRPESGMQTRVRLAKLGLLMKPAAPAVIVADELPTLDATRRSA